MQQPRRIAIDGPAGSGKSTIGEQLARGLGYLYIDTGAMYRAVTWLALQEAVDIDDGPALALLAQSAEVVVSRPHITDGRQYTVTVRGRDVTWDIRDAPVTRAVSVVSAHPEVRAILIAQQRAMASAQQNGVVMVGRDIGAVVLPDAELIQHQERQDSALPSMDEVLRDIQRRDEIDRVNMQPARDAIIIATDHLSVSQVLEVIYEHL